MDRWNAHILFGRDRQLIERKVRPGENTQEHGKDKIVFRAATAAGEGNLRRDAIWRKMSQPQSSEGVVYCCDRKSSAS